jgi:hypothetical protein
MDSGSSEGEYFYLRTVSLENLSENFSAWFHSDWNYPLKLQMI